MFADEGLDKFLMYSVVIYFSNDSLFAAKSTTRRLFHLTRKQSE